MKDSEGDRRMAATSSSPSPEELPPRSLNRAIVASALGNATEWFDYGVYAYGVSYLSAALVPGDLQKATLFTLATFAISFLVRPFGSFFWGPLGDRIGRKSVLAQTILIMSSATVCIGLIPSYDAIGIAAPLLLVLLRMVQGFSTGGEYGGAATFMAEHAPDKHRGFYGSFLEFGTLSGFSLGALLMLGFSVALGEEAMHEWGWRLPFLLAAPLGIVGMYLRSKMEDAAVFQEVAHTCAPESGGAAGLKTLMSCYPGPLLTLGGMVVALNVINYTLLSYMPTYFEAHLGLSPDEALIVPIIGMLFMMLFLPFVGGLSDRIGRKPLWWISLIGIFMTAIPLFHLMSSGLVGAIFGFAILGLLYAPQLATISATFPAIFPTHVRFCGFAVAYNVSTSLFGGTAPAVNEWLVRVTSSNLVPAYLMMGACVMGAIALLFVVETAGHSIRGTKIPGTRESQQEIRTLDSNDETEAAISLSSSYR